MTIFCVVTCPVPLGLLVVDSYHFFNASLRHYTVSAKFRLNPWVPSEDIYTSTISSWVLQSLIRWYLPFFLALSLTLIFFIPIIMFVGCMDYVHSIKFPFRIVFGAPPPILAISDNIFLWFIYSPRSNIFMSLGIILVGVPFFCIGVELGCIISSSLKCFKNRSFFSLT